MFRCSAFLVVATFLGWAYGQGPDRLASEREVLKAAGLPFEGPELLQFFRERTLSAEQIAELGDQIKALGSPVYAERVKASAALVKAGPLAKKLLIDVTKNPDSDLETIRRAEIVLKKIAEGKDGTYAVATARLIADHRTAGAGKVLLGYVPFANEGRITEAVQEALNRVAVRDGKIDPPFVTAIADKHVGKRAAAAEAIVRAGGLAHKDAIEPLLKADEDAKVRLPVVLALVEARDSDAVSLLIELLLDLPAQEVWQVEDMLHRIAGAKAPQVWVSAKTPAKEACARWLDWWEKNRESVDLAKVPDAPAYRGFLVVLFDKGGKGVKNRSGSVLAVRPNREIDWRLDNLNYPVDAQALGEDKLLITEYTGRKITERDRTGKVLWEKDVALPIACQRLPGGDLFLVTRQQVSIFDRDGKELFAKNVSAVSAAGRARDGHFVTVESKSGHCTWYDPKGAEVKSFEAGTTSPLIGSIDVLPDQHILLPLVRDNKVAEFDMDGKMVWHVEAPTPIAALRLPSGNTLVASGVRVIEFDRTGQEVWSFQPEGGRPFRLRRR